MKSVSSTFFVKFFVFVLFTSACGLFFVTNSASAAEFSRNLKQGDVGEDVRALQKLLNEDPATLVATTGSGSYGQESTYFGAKTYDAVIRFQAKYSEKTLIPAGLTVPTGFVGPLTRSVLLSLSKPQDDVVFQNSTQNSQQNGQTEPLNTPSSGQTSSNSAVSSTNTTSNLENSEAFISALLTLGKEKGFTEQQLAVIPDLVRTNLATTTDLKRQFLAEFSTHFPVSSGPLSFSSLFPKTSLWDKVVRNLSLTNTAHAQVGGIPFGGRILSVLPCTCTGNSLLWITPLPPSFATMLSYYQGTQAYLSYNLPFSLNILGKYAPTGSTCFVGAPPFCAPMPSVGTITPMVGSSPL